jgi:hypothetical protein
LVKLTPDRKFGIGWRVPTRLVRKNLRFDVMIALKSKIDVQKAIRWIALLLIMMSAMGLVWWITRAGPGMSGDSVRYLMGAENLLSGNGYSRLSGGGELRPITGFPPFYSILLAMIGWLGFNLTSTARWLNILLLGINILLLWTLVKKATCSLALSYLSVLFFSFNLSVLKYHSWIFTEPLYLALTLAGIFLLWRFHQDLRVRTLISGAVFIGLAAITRLIGLSLVLAGFLFLLVGLRVNRSHRLKLSLAFLALSSIPFLLWLVRNSYTADTALNRTVLYHPMPLELIKGYLLFLGDWVQLHRLLPGAYRSILALFIAAAGPVAYLVLRIRDWRQERRFAFRETDKILWLLFLYGAIYLGVLYVNSTLIDASTTPYAPERYLVVMYPIFIMFVLLTCHSVVEQMNWGMFPRIILLGIAGLIFALQAQSTWEALKHDDIPMGYTTFIASNEKLVDAVKEISKTPILYSNNPELTYAISGYGAYILPYSYNTYTDSQNPDFLHDVAVMEANLAKGAVIIHYGEKDEDQVELYRMLDLELIESISGTEILEGK